MRIRKDYTQRGKRTPAQNIAPSIPADEAKMGAGSGANSGNMEQMIAHETAMHSRAQRSVIPNAKLNKK